MKFTLLISIGIILCLAILLYLSSVSVEIIETVIFVISLLAGGMTIGAYFNTVPRIKNDFRGKISKRLHIFSRHWKRNEEEISKYYIFENKKIERKTIKFFKLMISIWGLSSSIAATAVQISIFLGLENLPQLPFKSPFQVPPQYSIQLSPPTAPEPFILFTYLICVPMIMGFLTPAMLLRTMNIRYRKEGDLPVPIPKFDFAILAGIAGIIAPAFLFFNNVTKSFEMQIQLVNFLLLDLIVIGIPIAIFCLFYVWDLEPKLKPKILSYFLDELHIRKE